MIFRGRQRLTGVPYRAKLESAAKAFLAAKDGILFAYIHGSFVTGERFRDIDIGDIGIVVVADPRQGSLSAGKKKRGERADSWNSLTSGKYLEIIGRAYDAAYHDMRNLAAREKYSLKADGRHGGLFLLDVLDSHAFRNWYLSKTWSGTHPWEIVFGHPHGVMLSPLRSIPLPPRSGTESVTYCEQAPLSCRIPNPIRPKRALDLPPLGIR